MIGSADIDAMSDADVEAYLAAQSRREVKRTEPGRSYGILLIICAALGLLASLELIYSEIVYFRNPGQALLCDLNPLIGCSKFFDLPINTLVGDIPNALLGAAFFAGFLALGLVIVADGRFARWLWWLMNLGMLGGILFVLVFVTLSVAVERALCPWCMVVWTVTIPMVVHTWTRSMSAGYIPGPAGAARYRWWITGAVYLALIAVVVGAFWNEWGQVF